MMSHKKILRHELIGLEAEVVESRNPNQVGTNGVVVDETLSTLTLDTGKGEKKIAKAGTMIRFTMNDGSRVDIDGDDIVGRPEERIKKKLW